MADLSKVGLDIGTTSIKIVELSPTSGDKWKLLAAGSAPSPSGGPLSTAGNAAATAQIINKMVKEVGIRSKRVVLALPEDQVSSHVVEMPVMSDDEVRQALTWQVEQYIPIPADKALWSHQVVKKDTTAGTMEVLLVAAAKSLVASYTSTAEQAGLEVVAVETELMATARAVYTDSIPLMLVVDLGANGTNLGLVSHGQLMFARTIPTGGSAFTRAIETGLNLDTTTAEQYKATYGFAEDKLKGELLKAMNPVLSVISGEIRKTADFYSSKHANEQVRLVVLTGGVANLPEMVRTLSGQVGMEVVMGNPLTRIQMTNQQTSSMEGNAPIYTVALGLAMRPL